MSPLELCWSQSVHALKAPGVNRLVVAFSGGADSTCLLHLLSQLNSGKPLIALHINHQLHADADVWQSHCEAVCRTLGVTFRCVVVNVARKGSLEAAARDARYAAFEAELSAGDLLLLAHHADDQIETVLFNLVRGHAAAGLMGMPSVRGVGNANLVRPLLGVRKREIIAYCQDRRLRWIEDDSNRDPGLDRNFLRSKVVPVLESRWPDFGGALLSALRRDGEVREIARTVAVEDLSFVSEDDGLVVSRLLELPLARRRNVLAWWIEDNRMPHPSAGLLDEMTRRFLSAAPDAAPLLAWRGCELRRYRDRVYLQPARRQPDRTVGKVAASGEIVLSDPQARLDLTSGVLKAVRSQGAGILLPAEGLCVRFRHGGEKMRIGGMNRTLSKLFQEQAIPPWNRDRLPLIFRGDEMVAIPGVAAWSLLPMTADDAVAEGSSTGLEFWFSGMP